MSEFVRHRRTLTKRVRRSGDCDGNGPSGRVEHREAVLDLVCWHAENVETSGSVHDFEDVTDWGEP
jgi:hypothetical protein